jgi:hypothetical protein
MGLKSYRNFARTLSPFLAQVSRKNRDIILKKMYTAAVQKEGSEDGKSDHQPSTRMFRNRRITFSRIRARINNAVKELTLAYSVSPAASTHMVDIPSVIQTLQQMTKRLEKAETAGAILIHQEFRTTAERALAQKANSPLQYPDLKGAAIDYLFISRLNRCLDELVSAEHLTFTPSAREKIISKAFDAAFGAMYTAAHVKTTLRRLKERSAPAHAPVQKT